MYALAQNLEAQFLSTCIMGSACCDYQLRYTRVDVVFIGYRVILIFFQLHTVCPYFRLRCDCFSGICVSRRNTLHFQSVDRRLVYSKLLCNGSCIVAGSGNLHFVDSCHSCRSACHGIIGVSYECDLTPLECYILCNLL